MALGVNRVTLVGHVGGDPKLRSTPGGISVAQFSVATTQTWFDKASNTKKEHTEWHNCEAWGGLADVCGKYLGKGSKVYIEGSLKTDQWKDKDTGAERRATKIRVNEMQMLGGGPKTHEGVPAAAEQQPAMTDDIPF